MRRIKLVLAAATVMVAMLVAFAGPVMADDLNCRDARGFFIRCDHQLFAPVNQFDDEDFFFVNPFFVSPFFFDDECFFDPDDCFNGFDDGGIFFGINQQIG